MDEIEFTLYPPERLIVGQWLPLGQSYVVGTDQPLPAPGVTVLIGPRGDKGETGPGGPGSDYFVYTAPGAQTVWTIAHNLSRYPSVTVVDGLGRVIEPEITYLSDQLLQLEFAFAESGQAYLN